MTERICDVYLTSEHTQVTFCDEEAMVGEKTYVMGCDTMNEQLSWVKMVQVR